VPRFSLFDGIFIEKTIPNWICCSMAGKAQKKLGERSRKSKSHIYLYILCIVVVVVVVAANAFASEAFSHLNMI
jgi:hypothetical protein